MGKWRTTRKKAICGTCATRWQTVSKQPMAKIIWSSPPHAPKPCSATVLWLHPEDAAERKLKAGDRVRFTTESGVREFELDCDWGVVRGSAWFPAPAGLAPWQTVKIGR